MMYNGYTNQLISQPNLPPELVRQHQVFREEYRQQQQHPNQQQLQVYQQQPRYDFDYNLPDGYTQQQLFHDQHQQLGQKAPPGSVGPTQETPDRKRGKPLGSNATQAYYAAPPADDVEGSYDVQEPPNLNSTSEGAGGVQ